MATKPKIKTLEWKEQQHIAPYVQQTAIRILKREKKDKQRQTQFDKCNNK